MTYVQKEQGIRQIRGALVAMRDEGDRPGFYEEASDALAALARLEARIEAADLLRDLDSSSLANYLARAEAAEAAEARCERLEGALREIADRRTKQWPAPVVAFAEVCEIARAALAEEPPDPDHTWGTKPYDPEEPHADVPGAGQRGC